MSIVITFFFFFFFWPFNWQKERKKKVKMVDDNVFCPLVFLIKGTVKMDIEAIVAHGSWDPHGPHR